MLSNLSYSLQTAPSRFSRMYSKLSGNTIAEEDFNDCESSFWIINNNYNKYDSSVPNDVKKLKKYLNLLYDVKECYNTRLSYLENKIEQDPRNQGSQNKKMNIITKMDNLDNLISNVVMQLNKNNDSNDNYLPIIPEGVEEEYKGGKNKSMRRRKTCCNKKKLNKTNRKRIKMKKRVK